jgi:hypothetical protein
LSAKGLEKFRSLAEGRLPAHSTAATREEEKMEHQRAVNACLREMRKLVDTCPESGEVFYRVST